MTQESAYEQNKDSSPSEPVPASTDSSVTPEAPTAEGTSATDEKPEQTDNSEREIDGPQDVSQDSSDVPDDAA